MNESNIFIWIAIFAILSIIVNGLGILAIYRYKGWAEKAKIYFMCFAAGLLVSVPLMVTLPKAIKSNFYAGLLALLGFLFMFFSNKLIKYRTKKKELAFGITAAEGIGIHSLIDGVIYTITFKISILVGVLSALGLVIHEFAEGVITYVFWLSGGAKKKTAALYAFLVAGLTTPLGAFLAYPLIKNVKDSALGLMLGFVSGILLYLSSSHLLPEAREHETKHSTLAFLSGIGLAVLIVLTKLKQ